ncbi:hypothetical protein JMN32_14200 [Fulvivirga sp. 29W222]|uniref:Uncharacterized protein n=1 Tax=Fulvivirga marina TaxID=2494733 RepID=A0A937KBW1_9BACT|nr:hypothetical protein [Fulvivirga marina]MBL6447466.1 hypothetical protein [Fulvivirga marina]
MEKKRVIKSLENLDPTLKTLLKKKYPDGFESNLMRLTNAKNEPFFVVPLETDDTTYLVKIAVTKNSEGEYDLEVDEEDNMDDDDDLDVGDDYDPDFEG